MGGAPTDIAQERSSRTPRLPQRLDALFVGTLFADLVFRNIALPQPGEETWAEDFAFAPGGVANRAVAAARLGLETGVVARVGDDPLGRSVVASLETQPRLWLDWLTKETGGQTAVTVALTNEQDRSFLSYAPGVAPHSAPDRPLPDVRLLECYLWDASRDWITAVRRQGTVVVAGVHWDATGQWPSAHLDHLADADVFVCDEAEAMNYTRCSTTETAARRLAERVRLAVVTRGPRGALAIDSRRGETVTVPAAQVTPRDTTGAGDAFLAGLMAGIAASVSRGWDLRTQLWLASIAASLSTQHLGGATAAPYPREIAQYLSAHPEPGQPSRPVAEWAEALAQPREGE